MTWRVERSDDGYEGWEDYDDLDGDQRGDDAGNDSGFYRVVQVDGGDNVVLPYSNIVSTAAP